MSKTNLFNVLFKSIKLNLNVNYLLGLFNKNLLSESYESIRAEVQVVGRDPKVGRGTPIFNIRLYESSKI